MPAVWWLVATFLTQNPLNTSPRLQSINLNNGMPSLHPLVSPDPIFSVKEVMVHELCTLRQCDLNIRPHLHNVIVIVSTIALVSPDPIFSEEEVMVNEALNTWILYIAELYALILSASVWSHHRLHLHYVIVSVGNQFSAPLCVSVSCLSQCNTVALSHVSRDTMTTLNCVTPPSHTCSQKCSFNEFAKKQDQ